MKLVDENSETVREENHNSESISTQSQTRTEPTNTTIESANMDVVDENNTSIMQNQQSTSHQAFAIKEPLTPEITKKKHTAVKTTEDSMIINSLTSKHAPETKLVDSISSSRTNFATNGLSKWMTTNQQAT